MANIFRYIDTPASKPATRSKADKPQGCPQCNYSNNYYGDQVCTTAPR